MIDPLEYYLEDDAATEHWGGVIGSALEYRGFVALHGQLGAGKTTFCRGVLRSLGHQGAVKSPTFTLVEPYRIDSYQIFHFDLYRLNDANELEYLGVDDYLDGQSLCLVEWPERGAGLLPDCDLTVRLSVAGVGRRLVIEANSDHGAQVILLIRREQNQR